MTAPLSADELAHIEDQQRRSCIVYNDPIEGDTDAEADFKRLIATIRGLEAENRELREALRSFDEYKGNTCGWCDAEPGPLGKPQKHAPDCELAALLDVPQ